MFYWFFFLVSVAALIVAVRWVWNIDEARVVEWWDDLDRRSSRRFVRRCRSHGDQTIETPKKLARHLRALYREPVTAHQRKRDTVTTPTPTDLLDRDTANPPADMEQPEIVQHYAGGRSVRWLHQHRDIYDLLDEFADAGKDDALQGFTVLSVGWAAPLDENGQTKGAPSANPLRRRVSLAVAATPSGIMSRVTFFGKDGEVVEHMDDPGTATGSLSDAVLDAALAVFGDRFAEVMARVLIERMNETHAQREGSDK